MVLTPVRDCGFPRVARFADAPTRPPPQRTVIREKIESLLLHAMLRAVHFTA